MADAARWAAVRELYAQARQQPAAQRAAWLDAQPADAQVLADVRSLLDHAGADAASDTGDDFLAPPPLPPDPGEAIGRRIGAWELTRRLGAGGMGEVFEARRVDGSYEGRAAVKLLKRGMDSAAVLQRFAQERQVLASLNHPHIARLLDAGASDDGLPYFVMECVDGAPIDEALRDAPLERRIEVFLQLTDAVAYAHAKLLVHRDLKPGNVLVTPDGQVRLLDFGIAKALQAGAPGAGSPNDLTQGGAPPYTPHYASPEQVRGEAIHTSTDIYSLGVLLYQVLTGVRPTGRDASTPQQAASSVLSETPTRPSSLPGELVGDPRWAATRKRLAGDLDNILLKALEKDAARRYESVAAFAADLRAFLEGRPVSARAATPGYLAGKFVRRHRAAVAAALLLFLSLAGGMAATAWQAEQARRARDAAQARLAQIKRLTGELVFRFGDAVTNLPGGAQMQDALLRETLAGVEDLLRTTPDDAELAAMASTVHARIAELYSDAAAATLSRPGEAARHAEQAIGLALPQLQARADDWRFITWYARARAVRAHALRTQSNDPAAALVELQAAQRALDAGLALPHAREGHAQLLANHGNIAIVMGHTLAQPDRPNLGRPQDALDAYARAEADHAAILGDAALMQLVDRLAPPGDASVAAYMRFQLGTIAGARSRVLAEAGRLAEARVQSEQAVRLREDDLRSQPRDVALRVTLVSEAQQLGQVLLRLGEPAQALAPTQRAWTVLQGLLHDESQRAGLQPRLPLVAATHAWALEESGALREAEALWRQAAQQWRERSAGADDPKLRERLAWAQWHGALCLARLGRTLEAATLAHGAVQASEALTAPPAPAAVQRAAQLVRGGAYALLAELEPGAAMAHRQAAVALYERANASQPLDAPDAQALQAWRMALR